MRWISATVLAALTMLAATSSRPAGAEGLFPSHPDGNTVALWLFDDPEYYLATLTDASENRYDLRLLPGGRLVEGRFGRAFEVRSKIGGQLEYPIGFAQDPKHGDLFITTGGRRKTPPERVMAAVTAREWTWELWVRMKDEPESSGATFVEMGSPETIVFSCGLDATRRELIARSETAGWSCTFPLGEPGLDDDRWHHVAVERGGPVSSIRLYVDGKGRTGDCRQREVASGVPEETFASSFDLLVGYSFADDARWNGAVDEMRVSDVPRYGGADFDVPPSLSRNHGRARALPTNPNGPPLLFDGGRASEPIELGRRKHVFIDDVLLDRKDGVEVVQNPPPRDSYEQVDLTMRPWEGAPGSGTGQGLGLRGVYDVGERIHFVIFNDGFWMNDPARIPSIWSLAVSEDGLHVRRPRLGLFEWNGSKDNNIFLLGHDVQGSFFVDTNPDARPEERIKFAAFSYTRGVYVYVSPDGVHWRRNEVCALPLDVGGGVEMIWDDQKGVYAAYTRAHNLPGYRNPPPAEPASGNRYAAYVETSRLYEPWPFEKLPNPTLHPDPLLPLLSGPPGELPTPLGPTRDGKEIYRTRFVKYSWAPDVYLAFIWRLSVGEGERADEWRETELATSRDGVTWRLFGTDPAYLPAGSVHRGRQVREALSVHGLVRRGDEVWSYALLKAEGHVQGSLDDQVVRLRQRLDGFTSLDPVDGKGTAWTRPLTFSGTRLELNTRVTGSLRVAVLDREGREVEGYGMDESDPIRSDAVSHVVTWNGSSSLGPLQGQVVRLKLDLDDAKLYALQFVD